MDDLWLNRAGIVLNVFAGFLLAPELIGLKRIAAFEGRLERSLPSLHAALGRLRRFLSPNRWAPPVVTITTVGTVIWIAAANLGPPEIRRVAADIGDELLIFVGVTYVAYIASVVVASLDIIVGAIVRALSRGDRLTVAMVLVGITVFVLGNLFQLVATF